MAYIRILRETTNYYKTERERMNNIVNTDEQYESSQSSSRGGTIRTWMMNRMRGRGPECCGQIRPTTAHCNVARRSARHYYEGLPFPS